MTAEAPPAASAPEDEIPTDLRRQVRLLGGILGDILQESDGPELFADVERLRRATIALRREPSQERRAEVVRIVADLDLHRAEAVARAFTVYFQLINLAEEQHRVRVLRDRDRGDEPVTESLAAAVAGIRASDGPEVLRGLLADLRITPVLTAHPTEARRRAVFDALERVAAQLARLDQVPLPRSEELDVRRRLYEEIAILWRTAQLRVRPPTPLDEVRRLMALFDQTLFRVVPAFYRELDRALDPEGVGTRPPAFSAFLSLGSWVGGDRDGNPHVTGEITREAVAVAADHVLRGLENATRRIARSLSHDAAWTPPSAELLDALRVDEEEFAEAAAAMRWRAPEEPHRRKLALAAERLVARRTGAPGGYPAPEAFLADIDLLQRSLVAGGSPRLAYGELQHLRWQVETFGFHLLSLEVRQHSGVHAEAIAELAPEAAGDLAALDRLATAGWGADPPRPRSPQTREVLDTLRAVAGLQRDYGPGACRRWIISFCRSAEDILAVRALIRLADPEGELTLDVVPLFETRADLRRATRVLDGALSVPGEASRLKAAGRRMEVMLGYSDSAKDAGFLAANLTLYQAQGELAAWAARRGVALTLFHGRGGALGRGGGPTNRAVRGQAPGSVAGRFKVTEQGEVIFNRYRSLPLARRHLEQVTHAVLVSSAPSAVAGGADGARRFGPLAAEMAEASEAAYRGLVERPGFAEFFRRVTPIEEIPRLQIGSRPASRRPGMDLSALRAISWVFAWGQSRCNLPGWYGLGTGLEAVARRDGGLEQLRAMAREWPFFSSLLENAELSLVKADALIGGLYLELGGDREVSAAITEEFERSCRMVLAVTGKQELLESRRVLRRAVDLRNPYVDALSFLQVRCLSELRAGVDDDERRRRLGDLVLTTINGVAAGLQNTG